MAALAVSASLIAACAAAPQAPIIQTQPSVKPTLTPTTVPTATITPRPVKQWVVGFSAAFPDAAYRDQMLLDLQQVNRDYVQRGITSDLVVENPPKDAAEQEQQVRDLLSKGVDAMLVYPLEPTSLQNVFAEAVKRGVVVVSLYPSLHADGVYSTGYDQKAWAAETAKALADRLMGRGEVIEFTGGGISALDASRQAGAADAFKAYPQIDITSQAVSDWDETNAQQLMAQDIVSKMEIDGYWAQDSMATGALRAWMAANPKQWPVAVGEGSCQYLDLWTDVLTVHPEFEAISLPNPPGAAASALRISIRLLQGDKLDPTITGSKDGAQIIFPLPAAVTDDSLHQVYATECMGKPGSYLLDAVLNEAEIGRYFLN